jgi:hypothetical protein
MSSDGDANPRNRRGSITQAALSNLFQRGSSGANGQSFSGQSQAQAPIVNDPQRRRLSVTTLGLSGAPATQNQPGLGIRRSSMSTNSNNSDAIDESAIEDDDYGSSTRTAPTTPFTRRMSFGTSTMRTYRPGGSPGNGKNPTSPPPPHPSNRRASAAHAPRGSLAQTPGTTFSAALAGRRASLGVPFLSPVLQASDNSHSRLSSDSSSSRLDQQGFNWSEQLRTRAESSFSQGAAARASFSFGAGSPPRNAPLQHDRAKSVSDMPQPPVQVEAMKPKVDRPKPDAFQERILKGDFYMD